MLLLLKAPAPKYIDLTLHDDDDDDDDMNHSSREKKEKEFWSLFCSHIEISGNEKKKSSEARDFNRRPHRRGCT